VASSSRKPPKAGATESLIRALKEGERTEELRLSMKKLREQHASASTETREEPRPMQSTKLPTLDQALEDLEASPMDVIEELPKEQLASLVYRAYGSRLEEALEAQRRDVAFTIFREADTIGELVQMLTAENWTEGEVGGLRIDDVIEARIEPIRGKTQREMILEALAVHPEGLTVQGVRDLTGLEGNSPNVTLSKMKKQGFVRNRAGRWYLAT